MARGLAARKVGDQLVDAEGVKWELSSLSHFPANQADESFDSVTDLNTKIETFKATNEIDDLTSINTFNESTRAAIYFSVRNDQDEEKHYLRYFKKLHRSGLPFSWGGKQLRESTGLSVFTNGSQSEHLPIKPSDIIQNDAYLIPDDVISLINSKTDLPDEFRHGTVSLLDALRNNQTPFVDGLGRYHSAVEKYVGEYAGPMYIMQNQERLAEQFAPIKKDIDYSRMYFPVSGNWPLVDSFLGDANGENSFGISSKGGTTGGAAASIQTITDIYNFDIDMSHPIRKSGQEVIDSLNLISSHSMIEGPLQAANRMGLLSEEEKSFVTYHVENHRRDPDGLIPNSIARMMENIKPNMNHDSYSIGLHMLSGVAREVCNRINENPVVDEVFRTAFKEKNFVQIYAHTEKVKDMVRFSKFSLVDPSSFGGKIQLCAAKPYMATTKPKGKITFRIK